MLRKIFDKLTSSFILLLVLGYFFSPIILLIIVLVSNFVFNGNPPNLWLTDNRYQAETTIELNYDTEKENLDSKQTIILATSITPTQTAQQTKEEERWRHYDKKYFPRKTVSQSLYIVDIYPRGDAEPKFILVNDPISKDMRLYDIQASKSSEFSLPSSITEYHFPGEYVTDGLGKKILFLNVDTEKCVNALKLFHVDTHSITNVASVEYDPNYSTIERCFQIEIAISHIAISPNGKFATYWVAKNMTTGAGFKGDLHLVDLEAGEDRLLLDNKFLHDGPEIISDAAHTTWVDDKTIHFYDFSPVGFTHEWSYNIETKELMVVRDAYTLEKS